MTHTLGRLVISSLINSGPSGYLLKPGEHLLRLFLRPSRTFGRFAQSTSGSHGSGVTLSHTPDVHGQPGRRGRASSRKAATRRPTRRAAGAQAARGAEATGATCCSWPEAAQFSSKANTVRKSQLGQREDPPAEGGSIGRPLIKQVAATRLGWARRPFA